MQCDVDIKENKTEKSHSHGTYILLGLPWIILAKVNLGQSPIQYLFPFSPYWQKAVFWAWQYPHNNSFAICLEDQGDQCYIKESFWVRSPRKHSVSWLCYPILPFTILFPFLYSWEPNIMAGAITTILLPQGQKSYSKKEDGRKLRCWWHSRATVLFQDCLPPDSSEREIPLYLV